MSLTFNMNGGGSKVFGTILVNYPDSSTVSISPAAKYKDITANQRVYYVKSAGTYTVTATDGVNTESEDVIISYDGQLVTVTLSFGNTVHLYTAGDQSGWTAKKWADSYGHNAAEPSIAYNPSNMTLSLTSNHSGIVYYKADVTNYTTLVAKGTFTSNSNTHNGLYVLSQLSGTYYTSKPPCDAYVELNGTGTLTIDVTALTGEYYIAFGLARSNSVDCVFAVTEVYLTDEAET